MTAHANAAFAEIAALYRLSYHRKGIVNGDAYLAAGRRSVYLRVASEADNSLLSPFVLTANLVLFLRSEVILNVECLTDLLGRLALDHICNSLAANIKQRLNVQVIGGLGTSLSV